MTGPVSDCPFSHLTIQTHNQRILILLYLRTCAYVVDELILQEI